MTRQRYALLPILLTLTVSAVGGAQPDVPFRASIDTRPVITGSCGTGCITLDIPGSGNATHMGAVTLTGPSQVNLFAATQTATATLTAANGDTLVLEIEGTVQFSGPNPTDPVTFSGSWTVQSGSGRFRSTRGSGSYSGSAAGPSGELSLTGSISGIGGPR
jgi:hypothetical protein